MLCAALTFAVAFTAQPASAITNDTWEISPTVPATSTGPGRAYFVYSLTAGQVLHDSVTIRNLTTWALTFTTFASDAVNSPGNGTFGLQGPSAKRVDLALWVSLPPKPVTVPAGARLDLPFDVFVPQNATPGDHTGGIVAAELKPSAETSSGSARVDIVRALGVRIYARIAGQVQPGLTVSALRIRRHLPIVPHLTGSSRATISYTVVNSGNVRETPTGHVTVTDLFGRTIAKLPDTRTPELLPGGRATVNQQWEAVPFAGRFTAHLEVTAGKVKAASEGRFWAIPWLVLTVLVIALVLIVATVVFRRHRRPTGP